MHYWHQDRDNQSLLFGREQDKVKLNKYNKDLWAIGGHSCEIDDTSWSLALSLAPFCAWALL